MAGKPLLIRAAVIRKYGDWAWFKQALGLQGWRAEGMSKSICWLCAASSILGPLYAFNFTAMAGWRAAQLDMPQFWASVAFADRFVSSIFSLPGGTPTRIQFLFNIHVMW